jgi:hypothetical protein
MKTLASLLLPFSVFLTTPGALADEIPVPVASPPAPEANSKSSLRPVLARVAAETQLRRYGESALGLTGAGVLFGVGFAAEGPDMTWSHALWVTSGVIALGSVANLLVPSELEKLEQSSSTLSDAEIERRWQRLAEKARVTRRVEAVVGGLLGVASVSLGVLAFEGELGTLTEDERLILGSVLVGGGALGITKGAVQWFIPTPLESGFALATARPRISVAGVPSPNGFHMSLTGTF